VTIAGSVPTRLVRSCKLGRYGNVAFKAEVKNCRENSRDALRVSSSSPEVRGTTVGRWKISSRSGYGIGLILGKEITKGTVYVPRCIVRVKTGRLVSSLLQRRRLGSP